MFQQLKGEGWAHRAPQQDPQPLAWVAFQASSTQVFQVLTHLNDACVEFMLMSFGAGCDGILQMRN